MKYYDTIEDGESTPLHEGGCSAVSTIAATPRTKKPTSSTIVRALMVGTAVAVGVLLLMAGPSSKMMTTMNKSRNVDGMVVASGATQASTDAEDITPCLVPPYGEAFNGLSCKNEDGFCAGGGESFGEHSAMDNYETCYVSYNSPPYRCWSHSHRVKKCDFSIGVCFPESDRCDPVGYFDGDDGYDIFGVWHVSAPLSDGSCGNPCREFK